MTSPEPGRDENEVARQSREWLLNLWKDPTLWPVLGAGALIFGTLGAALLLLALEGRNPFAMAALAIVIVMSGKEAVQALRRGSLGVAGVIALMWGLSGCGALLATLWMPAR